VFQAERDLILGMRGQQNIGARRIQIELRLHHDLELSITSIQKILREANVRPLRKPRPAALGRTSPRVLGRSGP
jgi:hypothetical protein